MDLPEPGSTQLQAVGTPRPFSVQHNHVAGLGIDAVIHGVTAHEKLLRHEGTNTATLEVVKERSILMWLAPSGRLLIRPCSCW